MEGFKPRTYHFRFILFCLLSFILSLVGISCEPVEDHYIYGLEEAIIESDQADKRNLKSRTQYISVLYSNLFQRGIDPGELQEIERAIASIGDETLAKRMVISTLLRQPDSRVPTMVEMREDVETFIKESYVRFLVRAPTQAELIFMRNFINARPELEPHIIYTTFALSDEYQFY